MNKYLIWQMRKEAKDFLKAFNKKVDSIQRCVLVDDFIINVAKLWPKK